MYNWVVVVRRDWTADQSREPSSQIYSTHHHTHQFGLPNAETRPTRDWLVAWPVKLGVAGYVWSHWNLRADLCSPPAVIRLRACRKEPCASQKISQKVSYFSFIFASTASPTRQERIKKLSGRKMGCRAEPPVKSMSLLGAHRWSPSKAEFFCKGHLTVRIAHWRSE